MTNTKKRNIFLTMSALLFSALSALLFITPHSVKAEEATTLENVALGKTVSFRSLTDVTEEIEWTAYYPDETGFYGQTDHGDLSRLTDNDKMWGVGQNRSPATANTRAWIYLDLEREYLIDNIKVGYLSNWLFTDVVIQVSNDPTFTSGVTTIFAVCDGNNPITVNETEIYDGTPVGWSDAASGGQTGYEINEGHYGVRSVYNGLLTYYGNGASARYVRLTNNDALNGGAYGVTTICEIQVYSDLAVSETPDNPGEPSNNESDQTSEQSERFDFIKWLKNAGSNAAEWIGDNVGIATTGSTVLIVGAAIIVILIFRRRR